MFCKNCGEQIDDNSKFCNNCGEQIVSEKKVNSKYVGDIKKCPYCGAQINSFQEKCNICGFELRNVKVSNSTEAFKDEIVRIKQKVKTEQKGFLIKKNISNKNDIDEELVSFISSYPVPNTKEDILEFFILAKSNINVKKLSGAVTSPLDDAWLSLFDKVYQKAEIMLSGKALERIQEDYKTIHNAIRSKKRGEILALVLFSLIVIGLWFLFFLLLIIPKKNEDKYLNSIVKEIEIDIENKDFTSARIKANKIRANEGNSTYQENWDKQREDLLKLIDEEINKINK